MEAAANGASPVKKQEDDDKEKRDIRPIPKTLNRVPRACNACRKQKMRCEGADNPPCKRCRNTNIECHFEKPSREATLTGEAGLERIRSLESHVSEIRLSQTAMANSLAELVQQLRISGVASRSPPTIPPTSYHPSPSVTSPTTSTPTAAYQHASPASTSLYPSPQSGPSGHHHRPSMAEALYASTGLRPQTMPSENMPNSQSSAIHGSHPGRDVYETQTASTSMPPPFPPTNTMGPPNHSSGGTTVMRFSATPLINNKVSRSKRQAPPSSNATSAHSSDIEDDEGIDLPTYGLVAPWEVLRNLADVATERAARELVDGSIASSSRTRTPSPDRQTRRRHKKRRKAIKAPPSITYSDVVTKGIIDEKEARDLFKIFYDGCSTFLPVFDPNKDTFDALHERSPFAVNAICMVAARVRDGGGAMSEVHRRLLEEVQSLSSATLFTPVVRTEAIQSMILVSGWSDNGWLSGGHAVRMAMEFSLHKAWPRLLKRMNSARRKSDLTSEADNDMVIACRTWFCLYLFEHQLSYGTGRPAVLKNDDSIRDCRYLLSHPLAIEDDMRLVSTVELVAIRERVHNFLSPLEDPIKPEHYEELHRADLDFRNWYATWDDTFSTKYGNAAFYRQSLQIQQLHAELFHNATALRDILSPEDVAEMGEQQRRLALRSIEIAGRGLDITLNSPAYRKGMTYAVHYTHATATFAASFLLRLARLFPNECNIDDVRVQVDKLANMMLHIPGRRYALTLLLMLKRSRRKQNLALLEKGTRAKRQSMVVDEPLEDAPLPIAPDEEEEEQQPILPQEEEGPPPQQQVQQPLPQLPQPQPPQLQSQLQLQQQQQSELQQQQLHEQQQQQQQHLLPIEQFIPPFDGAVYNMQDNQMHGPHPHPIHMMPEQYPHHQLPQANFSADQIWRDVEQQNPQNNSTWISDQTLGGESFTEHGMDAFMIPDEFLPVIPQQIW